MADSDIRDRYNSESINPEDLVNLQLELRTPADFDTLVAFIRDPNNNKRYWHRSIEVIPGNIPGKKSGGDHIDILIHNMGEFDVIPCPEEHLTIALCNTNSYREKDEITPEDDCMKSAVGVAVYYGKNKLSLEQIIPLVGFKYHLMRKQFLASLN